MKRKFPQVIAIMTIILVLLSIVSTFAGAFVDSDLGTGLMWAGIFGFVFFAIIGWIMIRVYERVHSDEETNEQLFDESMRQEELASKASEAEAISADEATEETEPEQ